MDGRVAARAVGTGRPGRSAGCALVASVLLAAAGCASGTGAASPSSGAGTQSAPTSATVADAPPGDAGTAGGATEGAWRLTAAEVDGTDLTAPDGASVTLRVGDGRVTGVAACNTYTAGLRTFSGWRVGELALTRMACEEQLMVFERTYLDALARVDTARVESQRADDDVLVLAGPDVELTWATDPEAG